MLIDKKKLFTSYFKVVQITIFEGIVQITMFFY